MTARRYDRAVSFYDQVVRELVAAVGGGLFLGNLLALLRRRVDARLAAGDAVARSRPGSPVRGLGRAAGRGSDLPQAPVSRSVAYLVIGFVVAVWGVASLAAG